MEPLCADKARAALKVHFADLWDKVHLTYMNTAKDDRPQTKQEIITLANRVVDLINNKIGG